MSELVVCRGIPGCGKTTAARRWVAEDPIHRARVNRDDLRAMAHDGTYLVASDGLASTERAIRAARLALVRELLDRDLSVVVDDTNLTPREIRELRLIADHRNVALTVWDMSNVPLDTCVERDKQRGRAGGRTVGEATIREIHRRHVHGQMYPLPGLEAPLFEFPAYLETYVPPAGAPPAVLCDVDGTVVRVRNRDPYDMTRVSEDRPHRAVITTVQALAAAGHRVVFCSARTETARADTLASLERHVQVPIEKLLMRKDGDTRPDAEVKLEMFDTEIRYHFDVRLVLDDRNAPVRMWRQLGLTCLQVAAGDF